MNPVKKLVVLFGLAFLASMALGAQVFDFTLVNKTGITIDEIYVSPTGDDEWGDDVLDVDVLPNGKSAKISFDEDYEELLLDFEIDLYDLKVVDEDGDDHLWSKLKLETINSIEISLDKKGAHRGLEWVKAPNALIGNPGSTKGYGY